jgi:hypothetical protein
MNQDLSQRLKDHKENYTKRRDENVRSQLIKRSIEQGI